LINSKSELKYIVIQVTITLLIALIPIYFYIDATKNNQDIKDKIDLQNYANQIVLKIDYFERQNNNIFYYPRSNIYFSSIFDKNKNEIHQKMIFYKEIQSKLDRNIVKEMYLGGKKQIEIAKHFNTSKSTISGIIKKINIGKINQ